MSWNNQTIFYVAYVNKITGWWSENKIATDEVSSPAWEIVGKCWKYFAYAESFRGDIAFQRGKQKDEIRRLNAPVH